MIFPIPILVNLIKDNELTSTRKNAVENASLSEICGSRYRFIQKIIPNYKKEATFLDVSIKITE
jgi:hypothetical protein